MVLIRSHAAGPQHGNPAETRNPGRRHPSFSGLPRHAHTGSYPGVTGRQKEDGNG